MRKRERKFTAIHIGLSELCTCCTQTPARGQLRGLVGDIYIYRLSSQIIYCSVIIRNCVWSSLNDNANKFGLLNLTNTGTKRS